MTSSIAKRVLVLDDDSEMRAKLGLLLTGEGYQVSHAAGGLEAILLHRQTPFDLVIIELLLAHNEGFETLVELRRAASPPKLVATAKSGLMPADVHLKMARQLGAHETLAKPFAAEQLLAAARSVLTT